MPGKFTEKSGISFVSAVAEASFRLRRIAEPRPAGDLVKAAINRAAKRVGLPPRRVEDLWYAHASMVRAEEMDAIRQADAARQAKEDAAREQAQRLGELFNGVAERLRTQDEDFHRDDIASLLDAARVLGATHSALAHEPEAGLTPAPDEGDG